MPRHVASEYIYYIVLNMSVKSVALAILVLGVALGVDAAEPMFKLKVQTTDTIHGVLLQGPIGGQLNMKSVREFDVLPGQTEVVIDVAENDTVPQNYILTRRNGDHLNIWAECYRKPGEIIDFDLVGDYPVVTGSPLMEQINLAKQFMAPYQHAIEQADGRESFDIALQAMHTAAADYIKAHPAQPSSVVLLNQVKPEDYAVADLITPEAYDNILAPLYTVYKDRLYKQYQHELQKQEVGEGKPAPDFSLPDSLGNMISLSSLRGKYVMLDFWGTWCGWCIKGIPQMKEQYDRLKDHGVEFVSIACGDAKDKWMSALQKYQMPWIQLWNDPKSDQVSHLYAVDGFPTKLVINPEGVIINVTVGENPDFYNIFDNLPGVEK